MEMGLFLDDNPDGNSDTYRQGASACLCGVIAT
jgi:hypothetical protein